MSTPILATKLYVPPPRPRAVHRPRLTERLNEGLHRRLALVSAPAGFGKTTLIGDWLAGAGGRPPGCRWTKGTATPARFLAYLVAAFRRLPRTLEKGCWARSNPPSHRRPNRS
jgi:LuxR family maltose regulon positive regulatory protein